MPWRRDKLFPSPTRSRLLPTSGGGGRCGLLVAIVMLSVNALASEAGAQTPETPAATAPSASPSATAEYRRKLAAYMQARQKFDDEASAYWSAIAQKRRLRNAKRRDHQDIMLDDYVLTQPPLYTGPPRPLRPYPPPQAGEGREGAKQRCRVGVNIAKKVGGTPTRPAMPADLPLSGGGKAAGLRIKGQRPPRMRSAGRARRLLLPPRRRPGRRYTACRPRYS